MDNLDYLLKMGAQEIGENREKYAADLEEAINVAGFGWYNIRYAFLLGLFLVAAIMEPLGYSYVLPAAKCDLGMGDSIRGFVASVPYIAIVISSFPWGYLVDTKGRKYVLLYSSLAAGVFSVIAAFMPEIASFTIFKFLCSLCLTCPSAIPYTYIGEIIPQKHRDIALAISNAIQTFGTALVPLFAWAILPLDFSLNIGSYEFRPWRLLVILYASGFIICALFLIPGPESPKYLVSKGRLDEAVQTLQKMYAGNKGGVPEDYPIKGLLVSSDGKKEETSFWVSIKNQSLPLLKPPYIQWMCLNGFLHFGIFSTLNGLAMWIPDVVNRVLSDNNGNSTACDLITQRLETTEDGTVCVDTIDTTTFAINSVANIVCAVIAVASSTSVNVIGKKALLIIVFFITGMFLMTINFVTNGLVFAAFLSLLPISAVGIGCVNAFSVQIFPTHLRGMAINLTMMFGRLGSIMGANVAGVMFNAACEATFYFFGSILILCCLLSFLLPKNKPPAPANLPPGATQTRQYREIESEKL